MGWEKWEQKGKRFFLNPILRIPFYIFTLTLLSLLLPLSFLLLARLSTAQYPSPPPSFILSVFLNINPALLQSLLSFVSVTALVYGLTGQFTLLNGSTFQPRLHIAWLFLCVLQVSVGLGIEAIVVAGVWPEDYGVGRRSMLVSRLVFFIGLHETMLHWSRTVVRPVVDDTIFGASRGEWWIEKVAVSASFGALWMWRLRNEVEALVRVVEIKRELLIGFGMSDFISWWLYYLTVAIGLVRIVKGFIWFGKVLLCRRPERSLNCSSGDDDKV
ncbi:hypothetical protein BVC80_1543g233 [Macleaya cordata]|uniref:Transmembrane protein n=1 Tax=Macleaya cordata TaxID=56857 RepID=A0A200R281_MACCD|nr:hypothetical protein BVC80_1543g233 [Macleaya cordata]